MSRRRPATPSPPADPAWIAGTCGRISDEARALAARVRAGATPSDVERAQALAQRARAVQAAVKALVGDA